MPRASLDKQPRDVASMFDQTSQRYDLMNDVLSFGMVYRWRRAVTRAIDPQPGQRILDLAAGTGTSSAPFARAGATVVPCDFSQGMLQVGKRHRPELAFTAGDGTRLPFADETFDVVTISFGLRNFVDTVGGLRDMLRVTKPGGTLLVCEFSQPTNALLREVYGNYLLRAFPPVARAVSSNPESYVYLAESIQAWPDQEGLATVVREAGWVDVAYRNLTGGIVALHRAVRPGARSTAR